jgi:hypothetical protein
LSLPKQKEIFDYMSEECKKMTGNQDNDNAKINEIAIVVRTMFPQPSAARPDVKDAAAAEAEAVVKGPFDNIANTTPFTGKASAASSSATSATGKASTTKATGFTGKALATKVEAGIEAGITGKKHNRGGRGRKSRHYRKKRSTLKRRRIRRQKLTRKGRKRRHTKRR